MNKVINKRLMPIIISWAAVLIWMGFIFYLSSQAGEESNKLSTGITEAIVRVIEKIAPEAELDRDTFNYMMRKNAHFFSYLVLGVLSVNALRMSGVQGRRRLALAMLICVLYAISDEAHQLLVPGRGGQVRDVLIDSVGAIIGIALYSLFQVKRKAKPP